ncbi:MAG: tryptophan synthase subunit beta [Gemmatimonadetes bacterium]|uniref:Tryptophan synthase beta chain n=1 Tax=Candidatus Kutchimonas denitrificans TaxID=3056748 RepID=A0AAE4ZBB5_9BACT|nr:tryptophan synthase subunit beta [Gemmatimonadota bacterium]NIR74320.1 tryptophan synthase subunit beta [Candidatus Kutchimonas denitrificans]NIS01376.1 tryptophan synthase subunit beta [Gemmatimonadota bacterium]NIT67116.1 tryptophan synthase subunit beta [Gemmatimonadota bacterium]NIU52772.1 tryptophan synthase subunit beta [Gemmatimonadota bacterium]
MMMKTATTPGRFGEFGGRYVPETLVPALDELEAAFDRLWNDDDFRAELDMLLLDYVGRPTPLYHASRFSERCGGATVYLKREDLAHTGSHKLNNALGQALLARALGKTRLIAETGAGQHGVATATAAALLGLPCQVYMGRTDMKRQRLNLIRMELLGAEVIPVDSGAKTLKDATSQAIRDWMGSYRDTHYVIGSCVGPHPYPLMVRTFQSVIGVEARRQILEQHGELPDGLVACVGGGSNAIGLFHPFIDDDIPMVGVEAAGAGLASGRHSASLVGGRAGVLHGSYSFLLQDDDGQVAPTHSIAAGLDYPGVGPEHAWLQATGRARYVSVTDDEASAAYSALAKTEGIIPALESSHALAYAMSWGRELGPDGVLLVNLSGRGDKDVVRDDDDG